MIVTDESIKIALSGGTPGADSNDYTLFDSPTAFGAAGILPATFIKRMVFGGNNSQAGTLKAYFSTNKGTTWTQYYSLSVTATSGTTMTGPIDFDVTPYDDWKLVWTNGGVAQATWLMHLHGLTSRVPAT